MSAQRLRRFLEHWIKTSFLFVSLWGAAAMAAPPVTLESPELWIQPLFQDVFGSQNVRITSIVNYSRLPDYVFKVTVVLEGNPPKSFMVRAMKRTDYAKKRTLERTRMAFQKGVSPHVVCADEARGILVTDWVQGEYLKNIDTNLVKKIMAQTKKFHDAYDRTENFPEVYTVGQRALNRLRELLQFDPGYEHKISFLPRVLRASEKVLTLHQRAIPIHGDLHAGNILVEGGHPYLIDWGDSVTSDPYDDVASFAWSYQFWPDMCQETVLSSYLGREPKPCERAKLVVKMVQTAFMNALWGFRAYKEITGEPINTLRVDRIHDPNEGLIEAQKNLDQARLAVKGPLYKMAMKIMQRKECKFRRKPPLFFQVRGLGVDKFKGNSLWFKDFRVEGLFTDKWDHFTGNS